MDSTGSHYHWRMGTTTPGECVPQRCSAPTFLSKIFQPVIVGHEIAGTAVWVGDKVTSIKVGDRVGVGYVALYKFSDCSLTIYLQRASLLLSGVPDVQNQ